MNKPYVHTPQDSAVRRLQGYWGVPTDTPADILSDILIDFEALISLVLECEPLLHRAMVERACTARWYVSAILS